MGDVGDCVVSNSKDGIENPLENKDRSKKIIRVITIIVYLSSVSLAAIMLSLYYLFLWNPTVQPQTGRLVDPIDLRRAYFHVDIAQQVNRESTNGTVGSDIKFAANDNKDKMYEPKHKRKLVRVLTVAGYIFSVSLAAIMLSLFYVFIYNPGKPAGDNGKAHGDTESEDLHGLIISEESLNSMNETHSNIEREEPRALPLNELNSLFLNGPEDSVENKTIGNTF